MLRVYNAAGFRINIIECDGFYKSMIDKVKDSMNIRINCCNPNEHVPQVERSISVIKEWCRTHYHRMPFKIIPRVMIRALGEQCCKLLNVILAKGGVSKYYSHFMIMKKRNLNYDKDFKHLIGDYGMANQPTDNTMKARAVGTIYLRPLDSSQGGHECINLITGKKITSTRIEPLLITDIVVRQVEKLATRQGILSFKINTNYEEIGYDSAKIIGVGSEEATKDEQSIIKEYKIHNEKFEEVEENYKSSDEENENVSEYSAASSKEDNYEQNIIENNKNNNDNDNDESNNDNDNDEDY